MEYFVERVATLKRINAETIKPSKAAYVETFKLAELGLEEGKRVIDRALEDPFVRDRNCSLTYIASKRDSYRGNASQPRNAVSERPVVDLVGRAQRKLEEEREKREGLVPACEMADQLLATTATRADNRQARSHDR